ncbi:MAG: 2-C-methyl-D-erythritol 2,4-cyclodiphosphate synthase [Bacteroidia bacterium]|nr:2-C-methyl-D-erythritol 2,4-cyclodiphosphate synthase [Bacteroidia bacterium]
MRIGLGYDAHKFTKERSLRLGGVTIPHEKGLAGHSDADVVIHAVCDALLGAVARGDIGQLFPPTDPSYKDRDSRFFLETVRASLAKEGWQIVNVDVVVIAQEPRLSSYYEAMRRAMSESLQISFEQVSVKATTPEGMGALGRSEGIAAYAVALLMRQ